MDWEIVIGLEIHVQLKTQSKIFSGSSTAFGKSSNTQASYVDAGLPGILPSLNKEAVELALRFGIAIQADINKRSIFVRKNYFYPDLPKGYQITQDRDPIILGGHIAILVGKNTITVGIDHAHLEEDAGKSIHENLNSHTGIDLNRAGIPLLEIVSNPVMHSPIAAVSYAKAIHHLVQWINICDGNLQNGSFRIDANVSVRPSGEKSLSTRCEIKNLNSFRFLGKAIEYEANRHINAYIKGEKVVQETRLYDANKNKTFSMRQKESAIDYRYLPDPDLPPLIVSQEWIDSVKRSMPPMPWTVQETLSREHNLDLDETTFITQSLAHTLYFESVLKECSSIQAQQCIKWMNGPLQAYINEHSVSWEQPPISPCRLAQIIKNVSNGNLSQSSGRELFKYAIEEQDKEIGNIIEERGLAQINELSSLNDAAKEIIRDNINIAKQVKAGEIKAINALMGKIMKKFSGKIDASQAREALVLAINEELVE
ncbi:Asp-tRNA(Asn)/Glu-tRNA(Gln) amidotransferase subunit GatB [Candidatus Ichthyocystis sparus]|uniref:Asp-tRNA(Asn)/Glu-tRNA(Gln) amidotransferase subunit GatB n=1 Tax=Candidatus Ichthyocystis sparus TaxID=1561004 RepID=UPI000ACEEF73|nr:Asp-tRNA(Asn)/Glu-tRNA(Gln) amidotransferase subunit GatB [Candidatus Ichthyocystis sparus]